MLRVMILILSLTFILPALISAQTVVENPESPAPRQAPTLLQMTADDALKLRPMMQEVRKLLLAEKEQLLVLRAELDKTRNDAGRADLERRIMQVREGTEANLYSIQARYARAEGRIPDAIKLEAAADRLLIPASERRAPEDSGDTGHRE